MSIAAPPSSSGRVLITGGAGFIGSNLAHRLAGEGHGIVILDSLARPGVEANLAWLIEQHGGKITHLHADIRDASAVEDAVRGVSAVFHFAAQVAVTTSLADPRSDCDINIGGTITLLEALVERHVSFGIQTRIDLWKPDMLDLLGKAGCISIEAGVESLTAEGRAALAKNCRLSTDELAERLIHARKRIPFVQANLIEMVEDDAALVAAWRDRLMRHGVWANEPVPLYPYPSSPDYHRLWGAPDDHAWERAHDWYLNQFRHFSDIQDQRPAPLAEREAECGHDS